MGRITAMIVMNGPETYEHRVVNEYVTEIGSTGNGAELIRDFINNPDYAYLGLKHGRDIQDLLDHMYNLTYRVHAGSEEESKELYGLRKRIFEIKTDHYKKTGRWI